MSISSVDNRSNTSYILQMFEQQQQAGGVGRNPLRTQIESALSQMGYSTEEISTISDEIGPAIHEGMAAAGSDADRKSVTDSAIASVLEDHGVDATAFAAVMESVGGPQEMGPPPPPPSGVGGNGALLEGVAEQLGMTTSEITDIVSQIEEAVAAAMEGLGDDEDAQAAVEAAVRGVLDESGLDSETFQAAFETAMEAQGRPPMPPGGTYGPMGADGSSESSGSELLDQVLAQVQGGSSGAEDGSSDSSTLSLWQLLQNLPGGTLLDTTV